MSEGPNSKEKKWLTNDISKKRIIENLSKSGIPLELRASKIFENNGFPNRAYYYDDADNEEIKSRELEIFGFRNIHSFKIYDSQVQIQMKVFAECKYRDNCTYIAFAEENTHFNFPFLFQIFTGPNLWHEFYNFPMIIKSIVEYMLPSKNKEGVLSDENKIINGACNQLISACNYSYLNRFQPFSFYDLKYNLIRNGHDEAIKLSDYEIINKSKFIPIDIIFPFLIFDEESGLIKAEYDKESGNIMDIYEIGYGIYEFIPQTPLKYAEMLDNRSSLPIIITDIKSLSDAIKMILNGTNKLTMEMEKIIRNKPEYLKTMILKEIFP